MCRPNELTHKHHIIPKYIGGTNEPENLVRVTVTQHAMFHFCNYQLWGNEEDKLAWKGLSGQMSFDEGRLKLCRLNGRRTYENKTGLFSMSPERKSEVSRKNGQKSYENKTALFAMSPERRSEVSRKAVETNRKNGTALFALTFEERSENGKKGGKKGGRTTSSQKWQCTRTGHIANAGALTNYQRKRGIDTSNRIRIQ